MLTIPKPDFPVGPKANMAIPEGRMPGNLGVEARGCNNLSGPRPSLPRNFVFGMNVNMKPNEDEN